MFPERDQNKGSRVALAFTFTPLHNIKALTYLPLTVYTSHHLTLPLYIIPLIRLYFIKSVHLKWCAGVRL